MWPSVCGCMGVECRDKLSRHFRVPRARPRSRGPPPPLPFPRPPACACVLCSVVLWEFGCLRHGRARPRCGYTVTGGGGSEGALGGVLGLASRWWERE